MSGYSCQIRLQQSSLMESVEQLVLREILVLL